VLLTYNFVSLISNQFLHINAEKAPFFVQKLALTVLPAVLVFKDGVKGEQLFGFEDIGGKDDFRTEVRGAACSWGYTSWAY